MVRQSWDLVYKKIPASVNEVLKILLQNRGLTSKKEVKDFLEPDLDHLLYLQLPNMELAVTRIKNAIQKGEDIIVYSDYDCDGICGAAILWDTLNKLGAKVLPYVPHRQKEGYGLSKIALKDLAKRGTKLIVTVDHGITATEEIDYASRLGMDIIVTDHHIPPAKMPPAFAIIHTTRLCGTGVAFILAVNLWLSFGRAKSEILEALDLVAIATIADMVPLLGLNRVAFKCGLPYLQNTKRPGLIALMEEAKIRSQDLGMYEISHILAPRLNASGRLDHAIEPLRLLCTKSLGKARMLAKAITKTNSKRQKITEEAISLARSILTFEEEQLLTVLVHEEFHEGIIGLVAQRLTEEFGKPTVVIAKGADVSKGSARSVGKFDIVQTLRACSQFLIEVGGHPKAAGFKIKTENIEVFSQKLQTIAEKALDGNLTTSTLRVDLPLDSSLISAYLWETVQKLAPFGVGNPEPLFLTRHLLIEDVRTVGSVNQHLKLQVKGDKAGFSVIGFDLGEKVSILRPGMKVDLVYHLFQDRWNGNGKIGLKIKDLAVGEQESTLFFPVLQ